MGWVWVGLFLWGIGSILLGLIVGPLLRDRTERRVRPMYPPTPITPEEERLIRGLAEQSDIISSFQSLTGPVALGQREIEEGVRANCNTSVVPKGREVPGSGASRPATDSELELELYRCLYELHHWSERGH